MLASISRAVSFHFGCGDAVEEDVSFILMGLVSSVSEKICDEDGDKMLVFGDLGSGGILSEQ